MGLFSKNETCCICNQNEGAKKIAEGYICMNCINACGNFLLSLTWKGASRGDVQKAFDANNANQILLNKFSLTKKVEKFIELDENNKLWRVQQLSNDIIFTYNDIIKFELIEDGEAITKGGLGRALVGGVMLGGVGAVVGAVTGSKKTKKEILEYRIKIVTRHKVYPEVYINFLLTGKVKSNGILFKSYENSAQSILSLLAIMTDECNSTMSDNTSLSTADEIKKYKELLDMGAITQEEFDDKKKSLLNL